LKHAVHDVSRLNAVLRHQQYVALLIHNTRTTPEQEKHINEA
jgi:hypothetical protein